MEPVLDTLAAWLATYALHSTLLLGGVWLVLRLRRVPGHLLRQLLWRTALVGSLVTATLQTVAGVPTFGSEWTLPTAASRPAATAPGAAPALAPTLAPALVPADCSGGQRASQIEVAVRPHLADEIVRMDRPAGPAHGWSPREPQPGRPDDLRLAGTSGARGADGVEKASPMSAGTGGTWVRWLAGAWMVLAVGALARLGARRLALSRRLAHRRPVRDPELLFALEDLGRRAGLVRPARLTLSDRLTVPAALGRDEICLPRRALDELSPAELRVVLAHELAHLLRRDPVWLVALHALEGALFFQPLNRVARRQLEESAEFLCDEWAARQTGSPDSLARCLGVVAGWLVGARTPALAGMAGEDASVLLRRVGHLLDGSPATSRSPWWCAPALAVVVGLVACGGPKVGTDKRTADPHVEHPPQMTIVEPVEPHAPHDEVRVVHTHGTGRTHAEHEAKALLDIQRARERVERELASVQSRLEQDRARVQAEVEEVRRVTETLAQRQAELATGAGPHAGDADELARVATELARLHERRDALSLHVDEARLRSGEAMHEAELAMREATDMRDLAELRAHEALRVAEELLSQGRGSARAPRRLVSGLAPRADFGRMDAARAGFDRWLEGEIERRLVAALAANGDDAVGDAEARKLRAVAGVMVRSARWSSESLSLRDGVGTLERRLDGFDDRAAFDWLLTDVDPRWSEAQLEVLLRATDSLAAELAEGHALDVDVSDVEAEVALSAAPLPPAAVATPRPGPRASVPLLPGAPAPGPVPAPGPIPAPAPAPAGAVSPPSPAAVPPAPSADG